MSTNTFRFLSTSLLLLLSALPGPSHGSTLRALNHCDFDIWCGAAKNDGTSRPTVKVAGKGGVYESPLKANNDNIGSVLKCATNAGLAHPIQMELAVQFGHSWFDLSAEDGDPFLQHHRHAEIAGLCVLDCPPGDSSCVYPVQPDCQTMEDAWLYLC
ncbi:hypothetical protein AAE478_010082 [Parahypoxylon ruwenzoriense]